MTAATLQAAGGTREKIPLVALRLFADQGYEATSMRQIAAELNITKAALYYHFDSKEAILRALVDTMLGQISELVEWAKTQELTDEFRREVLSKWADIVQAHGLAMFRFAVANRKVVESMRPDGVGGAHLLSELSRILTPSGASVEDQLRVRLALMSINMVGFTGPDIDANDQEIVEAARRIAVGLLPDDL